MKYLKYFLIAGLLFAVLAFSTSKNTRPSEGISPGDLFPLIENLKGEKGTRLNLSELRGKKVLVNFWAAYDAASHIENVLMAKKLQQSEYAIQLISVSLDESEVVFEKTIAFDKVDIANQFWADQDSKDALKKRYRLTKGFKSYLLDEEGKILAMNLSPQNIDEYLN